MEKEHLSSINEKFHIPDLDNVENLVSGVVKCIQDDVLSELLRFKENGENKSPEDVDVGFFLDKEINSCKWLAEDNICRYHIFFDENHNLDKASFDSYNNQGYITKANPELGVNGSIHMCIIFIETHINPYKCLKDKVYRESILNSIKDKFIHEIQHMYQETMRPARIPEDNIDIDVVDLKKINYINAYDNVCNRLKTENDIIKRAFLSMLYKCNYTERNAHVAGFFQKLLNDARQFGKVLPFESYYESKSYNNDLSNFKYFTDEIFNEFRGDVIGLFGDRAKTLNRLKKIVTPKIENVLKKLKTIYNFVSNNISFANAGNIQESLNIYNRNKKEQNRLLVESLKANEDIVKTVYNNYYGVSRLDEIIMGVNLLFSGKLQPSFD